MKPHSAASIRKPNTSESEMRLEIVNVRRSLEAANAISDGNSNSLAASTNITDHDA